MLVEYISINGQEYPFYFTYGRLELMLRKEGYSFARLGEYLGQYTITGLLNIMALGLTGGAAKTGAPKTYKAEEIDDLIGMNGKFYGEFSSFISKVLNFDIEIAADEDQVAEDHTEEADKKK